MSEPHRRKIAVIGASGGVGRRIAERLLAAGADVRCQTRISGKLADLSGRAEVHDFDPRDGDALARFVDGVDVVVFALGIDRPGATTLFSAATRALIAAMSVRGVRRLIAITGVGAGETRGHGGFVYDWLVFPFFTRKRYEDKDRQEALIADSGLDWTIVRPAPFSERPPAGLLQVVTQIESDTRLTGITRDEVADFVVAQVDSDRFVRQKPFIGHA